MTRVHTAGNAKPYQFRPSDDRLGNRRHVHGAIRPLEESGFWARLLRRFG